MVLIKVCIKFSFCKTYQQTIIICYYNNFISLAQSTLLMTALGQTTIHSKLAKFQQANIKVDIANDDVNINIGRVVKGVNSQYGNSRSNRNYWTNHNQKQIMKQIQVLPKSKLNVARKMKNKRVIPGIHRNDEIVLMESSVFPAIYFKKTALRNVLKQFAFPNNCQQMASDDQRTTLIYQIVSNLFNQINFYIFNIIAGENLENNSYYVFFSDSETLPFTKCCNAPVFLELQENGSGKILCNSSNCTYPSLAEFLINFDDGKKLWPDVPYFSSASYKDKQLKNKISKLIINGKYKRRSLVQMVQQTSKQIVGLFYQSKKMTKKASNYSIHDDNTFVTGAGIGTNAQDNDQFEQNNSSMHNLEQNEDPQKQQQEQQALLKQQDTNVQTLKMKLKYVTKKQVDLPKRLSKRIVEESQIFQHNFDIIRRIDEQMLKIRNARTTSKISFPRLMSQIQRTTIREKRQREKQEPNKTFHN